MIKKLDGFQSAIEMLQGLDLESQKKLIDQISKKDPEMAEKLKGHLVSFEDLKYLTTTMVMRLLKEIRIEDLGLALRASSKELIEHFSTMLSQNMRRDLEDSLRGKPRALSEVLDTQKKIIQVVLALRDKGEIVISKDKSQKFV